MIRALWILVLLASIAVVAAWFADRPGAVSMEWQGYRVDTSVALVVAATAAVAAVAAILYRMWLFVVGLPRRIGRYRAENRRRRGYQALTRGMVAVAAGDADEAQRQGRRAEGLLDDPPLTMLLSAQAAQLAGDERAAESFFKAMIERPETEFLGVRGLLAQDMKRRDWPAALTLARRAYRLHPDSAWVTKNLFDLQVRTGQWPDAEVTLGDLVKRRRVGAGEAARRRAVLFHQRGLEAEAAGDATESAKFAQRAHDADPALVPASARLARLLAIAGKGRKAAHVVERTWAVAPHPDLARSYVEAQAPPDPLACMRAVEGLTRLNPNHLESHVALAQVALEAKLWGEARAHLATAAGTKPSARVCRMMAELEEGERADGQLARTWLMRATEAEPDPAWVCDACGHVAETWVPVCANCDGFATFTWKLSPRATRLAVAGVSAPPRPALTVSTTSED